MMSLKVRGKRGNNPNKKSAISVLKDQLKMVEDVTQSINIESVYHVSIQDDGQQRPMITYFSNWKQQTNIPESARTKLKDAESGIRIGKDLNPNAAERK
jgi:hypothetical protein